MKNLNLFKYITAVTLALLLAFGFTIASQQGLASPIEEDSELLFSQEELDQMLAPIALYPDALLAQILTAATYPLEVVSAARFVKENEGLKGAELLEAAQDKEWDPSVKAMLEFPAILAMMDEELEWTTDLGDAFLAQQSDVMDTIQRLREKAYAQGNLVTNDEQVIKVEPQTKVIIVETASPQIVYVPVYDPVVVYGSWWYPAYPPYCYYPARYWGAVYTRVVFVDLFWGGWGIWGWDWHYYYVRINVKRHNHFTKHHYKKYHHYTIYDHDRKDYAWRHDYKHRRNVGYRDYSTAERFGGQKRTIVTKKSSKTDRYKPEEIRQQPSKKDLRTGKEIQTKTRPLAINDGGRKDKKSYKAPRQDLSINIEKQLKVKQPKRDTGFNTEVQKVRRPSTINVDKGSVAITKQKTTVIEKTSNKKQIFNDFGTTIKNRVMNRSAAYDSKISAGFQPGAKSQKGNFQFNSGKWK
jgi:hypothetical protein